MKISIDGGTVEFRFLERGPFNREAEIDSYCSKLGVDWAPLGDEGAASCSLAILRDYNGRFDFVVALLPETDDPIIAIVNRYVVFGASPAVAIYKMGDHALVAASTGGFVLLAFIPKPNHVWAIYDAELKVLDLVHLQWHTMTFQARAVAGWGETATGIIVYLDDESSVMLRFDNGIQLV